MSLKDELAQLKGKLAGLKDRIEADDQEAITEGEKLKGEIEAKAAEIETAEKKAGLLNLIGKKEEEDNSMPEKKTARTLGENFVMNMPEQKGKRFSIVAPEFKAYNDELAIGTVASEVSVSGKTEIRILPFLVGIIFLPFLSAKPV